MLETPGGGTLGTMSTPPCQYVDVALALQQTIRERVSRDHGTAPGHIIGEPCGEPSVGSVSAADGTCEHFCGRHPLEPRIIRDRPVDEGVP